MIDTFLRMKTRHKILFSLLIGFAVICFWRGAWGLIDLYLIPDNLELSYWASLGIGFAILIVTNYLTKELV